MKKKEKDLHFVIQHNSLKNFNVSLNPKDILRILDVLQTDELCACNGLMGREML